MPVGNTRQNGADNRNSLSHLVPCVYLLFNKVEADRPLLAIPFPHFFQMVQGICYINIGVDYLKRDYLIT